MGLTKPSLEKAKTDRSTCRACGTTIKKDDWRVGVEAWRMGRKVVTWQKPSCFLKKLEVDLVPGGNRGSCRLSGTKFEDGDLRLALVTGGASGETPSKTFCKPTAASGFLAEVVSASGKPWKPSGLCGWKKIGASKQALLNKALAAGAKSKKKGPSVVQGKFTTYTPHKVGR